MKQHNPRRKFLILSLLVLGCVAVLATGTYAAYTSYATVKRVVAARTKETSGELRFSSNLLDPYNEKPQAGYGIRPISVSSSGKVTIGIQICNYPQGDMSAFNDTTIQYEMSVTYPAGYSDSNTETFSGTLLGGTISSKTHNLTIPQEKVSLVSKGTIEVVVKAKPSEAVNSQHLAARLQLIPTTVTDTSWHLEPLENNNYETTDAFNVHLYGTEQCKMQLIWNSSIIELGDWSKQLLGVETSISSPLTISLGGPDQPTSYVLQFYRVAPPAENESYNSLGIELKPITP